jgi:hypothetical protein
LLIDLLENLGSAHPAETYFNGFDYDLGERALGYLTAFDLDLNIFAASIGMTKTSIKTFVQGHGASSFFQFESFSGAFRNSVVFERLQY